METVLIEELSSHNRTGTSGIQKSSLVIPPHEDHLIRQARASNFDQVCVTKYYLAIQI